VAVAAYLALQGGPPASTPSLTCVASSPGVQDTAWTRWPHAGRTWSCTFGGCRRSAGSSHPLSLSTTRGPGRDLDRGRAAGGPGRIFMHSQRWA
jgi:hypothetical protein